MCSAHFKLLVTLNGFTFPELVHLNSGARPHLYFNGHAREAHPEFVDLWMIETAGTGYLDMRWGTPMS